MTKTVLIVEDNELNKFDGFARGTSPRGGVLSESAAEALGARVFDYVTGDPGRLLRRSQPGCDAARWSAGDSEP
jgi:hypothetical protein